MGRNEVRAARPLSLLHKRYGCLIGSGLYFGDSGTTGEVPNRSARLACWAEAFEVEKLCEADPVAPN